MTAPNDIRYRARCFHCNAVLGDAYLALPVYKRLCWNHQKPTTAQSARVPVSQSRPTTGEQGNDTPV